MSDTVEATPPAYTSPPPSSGGSRPWTLWPVLLCVALIALAAIPAGVVLAVIGVASINLIPIIAAMPLLGIGWSVVRFGIRIFQRSTEGTEALIGLSAALFVVGLIAYFFTDGARSLGAAGGMALFAVTLLFSFLHLRSGEVPPLPAPRPVVPLMPEEHGSHVRSSDDLALTVSHLTVEFPVGRTGLKVHAVTDVSFDVRKGETLGLVGESGCGKSTTGKALLQFPRPTSGDIWFDGHELTSLSSEQMRAVRPNIQMIFQDPISSLNPRRTVGEIVGDPLKVWHRGTPEEQRELVARTLDVVGLDPEVAMDKRPHEFSGGQCQRICVARALVLEPDLIICDEPVSALDVSVQAQILNLLEDLKAKYGLTLVFIAHDLAVVKNISDRVAVMYLGKLCEIAPPDELYHHPAHPYTHALIEAIPVPDPTVRPQDTPSVQGEIPSPVAPPSGCRFRTRCPKAQERCAAEEPPMRQVAPGHHVACHFPLVEAAAAPQSEVPVSAP
jgi:peptide/nickel transport system ATP-binding protein